MTSIPFDDEYDAEAYDLEALPAGGPVDPPDRRVTFADVVGRSDQRRPIVPASLRSPDQRSALARWAAGYGLHTAAYHLTRSPKYLGKVLMYAPRGAWRGSSAALFWTLGGRETFQLQNSAANRDDPHTWQSLERGRAKRASGRLWAAGAVLVLLAAAVITAAVAGMPPVGWWAAVVGLVLVAAHYGRPADRPILDRVTPGRAYRKLTAETVRAALLATGYGKEPSDYQFPREIVRDGPGYSALVNLPAGVTAGLITQKREQVAGSPALRLPLDQVWMKPGAHTGQVELWVADQPLSQTPQPTWPLLKAGRADIFKPLPFGTDERNNPLAGLVMFVSLLIGAIPRMGKTFVLRLLLLGVALDPRVEVWAADLKGTGDLRMFERIARRYFVGDDDDEVDALLASLRELVVEMRRRAKVLRSLPADVCPESKVTPELAANKSLGLHPIVVGIDECQVMFTHPKHGKEFDAICTDLAKRGPALGIILMLATQRPDAASLPTGISGNAGARLCLKVMGQQENDMVLGQSMFKNGFRATQFALTDKGLAMAVGFFDAPTIVRTYYVDAPTAERIVDRAIELRGAAGTLPDQHDERPKVKAYNLLADVRAVWVSGEAALWSELLVPRLAELRPDVYGQWDVKTFGAAMKAAGVPTVSIHRKLDGGKGATKYGVKFDVLTAALPADSRQAIED
ncbi:FtsK/SpoIIIE domain-containing protein [Micromonospora sp. WMMA1998]|uniref:FtsK/SpoIIIE domain-containing protein n=1 Tax=Micromonospora sp. WMMA1998 TaxID=3015167 RepID=UPI00248C0F67|nr:FtsK/SpoIIIE domain-containing protein [Micromonospora sp. WMMA1998]WBC13437.1 FtsK/SpoIIIE domain-containing protein [Micromonospora sp. WMMA1998]